MGQRINYLSAKVETGATVDAVEHLRMYPLASLSKVEISPTENGCSVPVTFYFDKRPDYGFKVTVFNAFSVGYKGEGPWGLHTILTEAGFPASVTDKIFELSRHETSVLTK